MGVWSNCEQENITCKRHQSLSERDVIGLKFGSGLIRSQVASGVYTAQ